MSRGVRTMCYVGCAVATLWSPVAVHAQALVGDVVDDTRSAVAGATIGVFDARGRLVAQGVSDDRGHFRIEVPASGLHRLHIARLSYRSLSGGPYELRTGVELELFVVMHPAPVPVDGIDVAVTGTSARLEVAGFYERRGSGFGYHFDREALTRRGAIDVSDFLVRAIPGLKKSVASTRLIGQRSMQSDELVFERGFNGCAPSMWVDGVLVRTGGGSSEPLRPDDWFSIDELEGLEFYGTVSGVPMEFASAANCAVLIAWTRGSGRERGRRK